MDIKKKNYSFLQLMIGNDGWVYNTLRLLERELLHVSFVQQHDEN